MPDHTSHRPIAYGTPQQFAVYMESVTKFADAEPDDTYADFNVRIETRKTVNHLRARLGLPTTWQEANPGRCCACDGSLTKYSAEWKPLCVPCGLVLAEDR